MKMLNNKGNFLNIRMLIKINHKRHLFLKIMLEMILNYKQKLIKNNKILLKLIKCKNKAILI